MTAMARLTLSVALLAAWLVSLMSGVSLAGAIHLLLLASLVLFPWREKRNGPPA